MSPGRENPLRAQGAIALCFLAFFLLLFAQFPAAGRLPGNCDTWYAVAFTNIYINEIKEALGLGQFGSFLYPAESPFSYGETSVLLATVPMLLRLLGLSDVATYYVFISLVYAATGFAAYRVASLYVEDRGVSTLAGLAFSSSNFLLSTIDSPHTAFWGVAFLAFYFFKRYSRHGRTADLWWAGVLAGAQVYVSAYVFLLLALAVGAVALNDWKRLLGRPGGPRQILLAVLGVAVGIAPFAWFYATKLEGYFSWRGQAVLFAEFNSLDPGDLLRPMPGNLLYPAGHRFNQRDAVELQKHLGKSDPAFRTEEFALLVGHGPRPDEESLWVSSRRSAFVGVVPYVLALLCVGASFEGKRDLIALFAAGLLVALGPGFTLGSDFVPLPLYWVYEKVPGFHMFRIPGRAFALSVLALEIAAAMGLDALLRRLGLLSGAKRNAAIAAGMLLVLLENVPFPMRAFAGERLARPPEDYLQFLSGRRQTVLLNLPSGIGYGLAGSAQDLYAFNRELIYMNWQTYHRQDIVNGVNGYIPHSRIQVQRLIATLPSESAIAGLRELGVRFIAFNKGMLLPGEPSLIPALRRSRMLIPVLESESTAVFGVRP